MRKLAYFLFAILLIAIAGGVFLALAVPTDFVRDRAIAFVKAKTGRDLVIAGGASFTLIPRIGITLRDVTLSPPPGMEGPPFVRMAALEVSVPLLPLLRRELQVDRLVLVSPVFDLRRARDGRASWEFAGKEAGGNTDGNAGAPRATRAGTEQLPPELEPFMRRNAGTAPGPDDRAARPADADARARGLGALKGVRLGDVRIVQGTVHYSDAQTGARQTLEQVNVTFGLEHIDRPLTGAGDLAWRGQKIVFKSVLARPRALLEGGTTPLDVQWSAAHLTGTFKGELALGDRTQVKGRIASETASVRKLAAWLGATLPPSRGFGAASLAGLVNANAARIQFNDAKASLDGAHARGDVQLDLEGARPFLRGRIELDRLDLNTYLPENGDAGGSDTEGEAFEDRAAGSTPADGKGKPRDLTQLIERLGKGNGRATGAGHGPTAAGTGGRALGWSGAPIELGGLGVIDAKLDLSVGQIIYRFIKIGKSRLEVLLERGRLVWKFLDVWLYGGRGRGALTLDASRPVPTFDARFALDGVEALPLLKDAAGFEWVEGKGRLSMALAGTGRSEREIVSTLQGRGGFAFFDGAIVGVNIPAMARALQRGTIPKLSGDERQKTDFSQLNGSFQVERGVARSADLSLVGPLIRVRGAGLVDIPAKAIDFTVKPSLVATLEGQGSSRTAPGLTIPVRIRGPWTRPAFEPDFKGILENPEAAVGAVKNLSREINKLKKGLKGKDASKILEGLFGGGQGGGGAGSPAPQGSGGSAGGGANSGTQGGQSPKVEDLLKQFLR